MLIDSPSCVPGPSGASARGPIKNPKIAGDVNATHNKKESADKIREDCENLQKAQDSINAIDDAKPFLAAVNAAAHRIEEEVQKRYSHSLPAREDQFKTVRPSV